MIARRAVVSGRVQGVGFRFFARRAAREAGVRGWIRNRPDGTVESLVEGEDEAVARYVERLREGPHGSRVSDVEVREAVSEGAASFEITG